MKKKLSEPKSGILTLRYLPDNNELTENPPRFTWMPCNRANGPYTLEISQDENFAEGVYRYNNIKANFFAPDIALPEGKYFWRFTLAGGEYDFSTVSGFEITPGLPETPFPNEENRFKGVDTSHPRLWLNQKGIEKFREELAKDPSYCKFDTFVERTVMRYVDKPFVDEPLPYPNGKREIAHWRNSYMICQEAFNHIRYVGVAGVILQNQEWIDHAVASTLAAARWDINGTTSRHYNDECGFKLALMLAWGYDWLYNYMTEEERAEVRANLEVRTAEIVHHAFVSSKIHYSLYDSHAVRSISMCVVPCSVALFGDVELAESWLSKSVDYYNVLFAPWGGKDGGWSEGPLYWCTATTFMLDSAAILKNFAGVDILVRPFMQATANFPIYCYAHDTYRSCFSDQACIDDRTILKAGFNAREFGSVSGNHIAQWYYEKLAEKSDYDDATFFNAGWWDFYFNDVQTLSNYGKIEAEAPTNDRIVKWFKDIGWVALHKNMADEENHIAFLTKSSPYGSVSHSHGDQNAFTLHAYGDALLCETGYYIGFNSSMHRDWRKNSRAHNLIEINGQSQYAKFDKTVQLGCVGEIKSVTETENYVHIVEDATKGYLPNVPELENYTREIYFVDDEYFVIIDDVTLKEAGDVSFYLHSLFEPSIDDTIVTFAGPKGKVDCEIVLVSSGMESMSTTNEFDGVDPAEFTEDQKQWHFKMQTTKAKKHTIVTVLNPSKTEEYKEIGTIKDDQGHDIFLYFVNDGKTFPLVIDGNKRY